MPPPAILFLARHGQSTWNAAGRWQGHGDPPLSRLGRCQAAELADRLARETIDALIASDLARAAETAAIVGARLGLEVTLDPRLREIAIGEWTGLTEAEIAAGWPDALARLRAGDPDLRLGGGESRRELAARVGAAIDELASAGARVAVVTHLGVIRTLVPGVRPENAACCRIERPSRAER